MICDFCLDDGASTVLDVGTDVVVRHGDYAVSLGRTWAACAVCLRLYQEREWDALRDRMVEAVCVRDIRLPRPVVVSVFTRIVEVMRAAQIRYN